MFRVNLLLPPGLQDADLDFSISGEPELHPEELLAENIASRGTLVAGAHLDSGETGALTLSSMPVRVAIAVVIFIASFLAYYNIPAVQSRVDSLLRSASSTSQRPKPVLKVIQVTADFLSLLPAGAEISYFEAGSGVVLYHFGGGVDIAALEEINAAVDGFRTGDVHDVASNDSLAESVGGITYRDRNGQTPWKPSRHAYDLFFDDLKRDITLGGGEVMKTSVGNLKSGEYIIRGDLNLLLFHLNAVVSQPPMAKYHSVSILDKSDPSEDLSYQMRVVFDLL